MSRYHGMGRKRPMKKQKVSNLEQDCEEPANDNRSVINGWCDEMKNEDYDEFECDSISNNCYLLKNPKVGSESYNDLSKLNQRSVQHACNRVKAFIDSICHESWQLLITERILSEVVTKFNDTISNPNV
jgi:hypothetical protein